VIQFMDRSNRSSILTRARVLGAIHQVDAFDDSLGDQYMHRFGVMNNPEVMTESEAYAEAWRVLHDEEEKKEAARLVIVPSPLLETQDRVSFDGVDYRVLNTSLDLTMDSEQVRIGSKLELRQYLPLGTPPDRS
jgi:hypothetical protein